MNAPEPTAHHIHAALFVDFDNVFSSLYQQDSDAAEEFAKNPEQWLSWLEHKMPCAYPDGGNVLRRILVRRCYLNPHMYRDYRPYFVRSAFEVIDCPPLTGRGKTSTDIHMVIDILDLLHHAVYFNEFIILSSDADFTPVLIRLRQHDRYTVVVSLGYGSLAYKSACDHLVTEEVFVREAMGVPYQEEEPGALPQPPRENSESPEASPELLNRMAARLHQVAQRPEGIEASDLPAVYREFPEFRQSEHWLGYHTLRRLTQALVACRDDLVLVEDDPWRVASRDLTMELEALPALPPLVQVQNATGLDVQSTRAALSTWVQQVVGEASAPVPMATLAQAAMDRFGAHLADQDWLGAGTFKNLLQGLPLGNLQLSAVGAGFIYDPQRHTAPVVPPAPDRIAQHYPELAPLARKIHDLTDTPYLSPEHYALLLRELAREINEHGYHMSRTSKTVRDRCVERGAPVSRSQVNFVLIGIGYSGHRFGVEEERAVVLGEALVRNTINLCRAAQFDPSDAEIEQVQRWIMGGLGDGE